MYSDDDLKKAVEDNILTAESVEAFRNHVAKRNQTLVADEENVRLVTSFNDIFVSAACLLFLFSLLFIVDKADVLAHPVIVVALVSWGLSEFFVRQRKMALPAIVLLLSFLYGLYEAAGGLFSSYPNFEGWEDSLAGVVTLIGLSFHWFRFRVPITVGSIMVMAVLSIMSSSPEMYRSYLALVGGIVIFSIAMRWDMADRHRQTRRSDIAFWLHLFSGPLIVYAIYYYLDQIGADANTLRFVLVIGLFLLLTLISLIIDRRAFIASSVVYVITELVRFFVTDADKASIDNFAYVGALVGFMLLLLTGFWGKTRHHLLQYLPEYVLDKVPPSKN